MIKQHEKMGRTLGGPEGMRPKRTRGYYRALKRGATWALVERATRESCRRLAGALFAATPDPNCPAGTVYGLAAWLPEVEK